MTAAVDTMSVLENGTNIGSANARKASVPVGEPMQMERTSSSGSARRPSSGPGSRKSSFGAHELASGLAGMTTIGGDKRPPLSRSSSRRGSGTLLTPSGTQVVYHTRTHVRVASVDRSLTCLG